MSDYTGLEFILLWNKVNFIKTSHKDILGTEHSIPRDVNGKKLQLKIVPCLSKQLF